MGFTGRDMEFVSLTVLARVYGCVLLDVCHWYLWLFKCLEAKVLGYMAVR